MQEELKVALAARRELGPELEDTLVLNFLQQIDSAIQTRVDEQVSEMLRGQSRRRHGRTAVVIVSLLMAFPVTIAALIAGTGVAGLAIVWGVILLINLIDVFR